MTPSAPAKVSVCIPVYNGSNYIAAAIQSILSQTYTDLHLFVCDNCSTDNTEEIVRTFTDSRVTYIRNSTNLGPVGNANRCLELADGEYVSIFHHDDVMLPRNLELKVHVLDTNPAVGFVHSNIMLVDADAQVIAGDIWNVDSRRNYIDDGMSVLHRYLEYLPLGASIFIGSVLARRSCYEDVGQFSGDVPNCADSEMWMRMMIFYKVACIGVPLVLYRAHPGSASSSWGDYTSLPYLRQHYTAADMILNRYKKQIPQCKALKRRVFLSFADRAVELAGGLLTKGDTVHSGECLSQAARFSPSILRWSRFWKVAAALTMRSDDVVT